MYCTSKIVVVLNLVVLRTTVFCFNFEDRDPLVKKAPEGQANSYFEFNAAQHKTEENSQSIRNNWLLVRAPLGQNLQPGSKCPLSNYDDDCERVETDGKRGIEESVAPWTSFHFEGCMSVGGGHFSNRSAYTYISGSPRSKMKGQVYFFEKYNNTELNISLILTGEQFASSFGYEMLAADVNNDGYDDLLIGAPFYYGEKKGGAVYIYYNIRDCSWDNCTWDKVFYGKTQSRYGFSMTSLGDINKDGYNDVAIGALYEEDYGAVYIYLGSPNGLNPEPSQVIRFKQLKTLGYSLSGGIDIDNNGYPDLLVRAYESENALLFKTRPIIDIKIKIKSDELKNINSSRKGCSADPTNHNYTWGVSR